MSGYRLTATFRTYTVPVQVGMDGQIFMHVAGHGAGYYITRREHPPSEILLSIRIHKQILFGQVVICGSKPAPYWIRDHCHESESKHLALVFFMNTRADFREFMMKQCAIAFKKNAITDEVYRFASYFKVLRRQPQYIQYGQYLVARHRKELRKLKMRTLAQEKINVINQE